MIMLNKISKFSDKLNSKSRYLYQAFLYRFRTLGKLKTFDENWFKNKRVAIVGSADAAFKEKSGAYIDAFDVVVRINKGVELVEEFGEFIGKKTDVLFHCLYEGKEGGGSPVTLELWKKHNVKKVMFSHDRNSSKYGHHLKKFFLKHNPRVIVSDINDSLSENNFDVIQPFHPTTGFIAINTIMNCNPKELYVTGLTFYKTPFQGKYREGDMNFWKADIKKNGLHDPESEYQVVKALYKSNPNIFIPDKTLKAIFEHH